MVIKQCIGMKEKAQKCKKECGIFFISSIHFAEGNSILKQFSHI